ncbi:hypothetical protein ACP70R_042203 [Stipagrostis hirtigluma subsp. patula]
MAQQAVFSVLERIGSSAVDEAKYLWGVSDKLELAQQQLRGMQAFLSDLDDKMLRGGAMARNLVSEVRAVTYMLDDIIDTANIMKRQSDPEISITGAISKYVGFPIYLAHLHKLGARIDSANARMKTIFEDFVKYNVVATAVVEAPRGYIIEDDTIQNWRSVHLAFHKQFDVIGFNDQIEHIKNDLLDRQNKHLTVVSIVGPGGIGKSTMAKKVYDLAEVKTCFEVQAWITISQTVLPRVHLLKELIKRLESDHTVEEMVKRTIEDQEAEKAKYKKVRELERFVPSHLLEQVLQRIMESEKAKEANKLGSLPFHHLEEKIKHETENWKAEESEDTEEVKYRLTELINRILASSKKPEEQEKYLLEELIKPFIKEEEAIKAYEHFIKEEEARKAIDGNKFKPRDFLEEKINHAIKDLEAKEFNETEVKYLSGELIKHAIDPRKSRESKEAEAKYLLEVLIRRSMECAKAKAKRVELEELNEKQLMDLLHKFALGKRYLIVLDDIWSKDTWDIIGVAFPEKKNGSRIILTTRKDDVAHHPNARKEFYKPKLLNEEESTRLLLSRALPDHILEGDNPAAMGKKLDEMKELAKELAVKCCGLPLAIVVLGGHLSRNLDVLEWRRLTSSREWHAMITTERIIGSILDLSYYDMPSHIRSCFLYTTTFPEDSSIYIRDLTSLWIAEGFIPLVRGYTRQEVAVKYVAELVQRCMVQVEKLTISGRIKVIKLHDILRDWGIGRARREGFVKDGYSVEDIEAVYSDETIEAYRVALHGKLTGGVAANKRQFRTLLNFYSMPRQELLTNFVQSLRVLYIYNPRGKLVHLPKAIGRMRYLRYLGLGGRGSCYYLPSSIGCLISLETFHAIGEIIHIPDSLFKILTLRHVYARRAGSWSMPRISSTSRLQVMVIGVTKGHTHENVMQMEATQRQIQKNKSPSLSCCFVMRSKDTGVMGIVGRCKEGSLSLCDLLDFRTWKGLQTLKIRCTNLLRNDQEILELGRMKWLQNLEIGERSYTGSVMTYPSGSFPALTLLVLHDLAVDSWKVERGSMPQLRTMVLCKCPSLIDLPEGLSWLPHLNMLHLIAMPPGCQQGTVARALKEKGCEVLASSNVKDFQYISICHGIDYKR